MTARPASRSMTSRPSLVTYSQSCSVALRKLVAATAADA